MGWLIQVFTESDNATLCPVRVSSGTVGIVYHAAAIFGLLTGALHIDMDTLGAYTQHMIELVGVGGLVVGAKSAMKGDAQ